MERRVEVAHILGDNVGEQPVPEVGGQVLGSHSHEKRFQKEGRALDDGENQEHQGPEVTLLQELIRWPGENLDSCR